LNRFAIYIFDYGAPVGLRIAVKHPERISAIVSQNGNAYEEGLSEGWNPIRAYWEVPSQSNRDQLRSFLKPETTAWQYTHGVPDATRVSPDGFTLDDFYLARPGADEPRLDLFGDYETNVALYPTFQKYFRDHKPPLLAVSERMTRSSCRQARKRSSGTPPGQSRDSPDTSLWKPMHQKSRRRSASFSPVNLSTRQARGARKRRVAYPAENHDACNRS